MARQNEGPWFRNATGSWYATVHGNSIPLKVKGESNRQEAVKAWHRLMADVPKPKPEAKPEPKAESVTVRMLVDAYLADAESRMTVGCLRNYRIYLEAFAQTKGSHNADSIISTEAEAFSRKPKWSASYRAGFLGCLVTAFKWAVKARMIGSCPLEGVSKPPKASRGKKAIITDTERQQLLAVADPLMSDYLTVLWATGARPGEVAGLTAELFKSSVDGIIPLEAHKEAHLGKSRMLILTGEAMTIVQRRAEAQKTGLLFAGRTGRKLTAQAIGSRMRTLCLRAGLRRCIAYGFRHTFATDALTRGVPDAHVASLLGHSSTAMLHKHYSHLGSQAQTLRDALAKVR